MPQLTVDELMRCSQDAAMKLSNAEMTRTEPDLSKINRGPVSRPAWSPGRCFIHLTANSSHAFKGWLVGWSLTSLFSTNYTRDERSKETVQHRILLDGWLGHAHHVELFCSNQVILTGYVSWHHQWPIQGGCTKKTSHHLSCIKKLTNTSQGSLATCIRRCAISLDDFITNLLLCVEVKESEHQS